MCEACVEARGAYGGVAGIEMNRRMEPRARSWFHSFGGLWISAWWGTLFWVGGGRFFRVVGALFCYNNLGCCGINLSVACALSNVSFVNLDPSAPVVAVGLGKGLHWY